MNILYCGDRNIEDGLTLSLLSVRRHVSEPLNVYVFTLDYHERGYDINPLREGTIAYLDTVLKEKNSESSIRLIDCTHQFSSEPPEANMDTRFTPCCMLRLYADWIQEIPDRILYLDYDVVCRKDFTDFYYQSMTNIELAGVLDYYGRWFYSRPLWRHNYLNSGVLLMNMKLIRDNGLFVWCRELCAQKRMFLPDQHALNRLSVGKKICSHIYNDQRHLSEETVFQHFSTTFRLFPYPQKVSVKPWDVERLHKKLQIFEYDDLLQEFSKVRSTMKQQSITNNL